MSRLDREDRAPFCVLCGGAHSFSTTCDREQLEWVKVRREEVARGVPWQEATPMPKKQTA